jgi:translation initiation factor 1
MIKRIPIADPVSLTHRPFAGLPGSETSPRPEKKPEAPAEPRLQAWAVVRLERKGRGGKEVTVIEKLDLGSRELQTWTKELKQSLGCGGAAEGRSIVLQGDQRDRAVSWLENKKVRKITRG